MANAMAESAAKQPGFLGVESAREELGITVSYWDSLDAIAAWKRDSAHLIAQKLGRERWYEAYRPKPPGRARLRVYEKLTMPAGTHRIGGAVECFGFRCFAFESSRA
jgi:hypothetical protein